MKHRESSERVSGTYIWGSGVVATGVFLGITATALGGNVDTIPSHEGVYTDTSFDLSEHDDSPSVNVLVIDNPGQYDGASRPDSQVQSIFETTIEIIEETTDGEVSFTMGDIDHLTVPADDRWHDYNCYSDDAVKKMAIEYRHVKELELDDHLAVVLNDSPNCNLYGTKGEGAGAYLENTVSPNFTVYNELDERITTHEIGHYLSLGHLASIWCSEINPSLDGLSLNGRMFSDVETQLANGCEIMKKPSEDGSGNTANAKIDEYSSPSSTMGNMSLSTMVDGRKAYAYHELARIDRERFPLASIELPVTTAQTYELSLEDGGVAGVWVPLPDDHPLRTEIDKNITDLSFGFSPDGLSDDERGNVTVKYKALPVALGYNQSYVLDTQPYTDPYEKTTLYGQPCTTKGVDIDVPIIYMDKVLDIVVQAEICDGRYYITVDNFANTYQDRWYWEKTVREKNERLDAHEVKSD